MATLSRSKTNDMYSWWWNSHITPKNSKWLKENLTDMDSKVRTMIRLIEVDEDSFARRAEMYYKRRPELMKLVEEFYRAYRALAERYDHATGVIRHAHQTMAEAFPNQVPFIMSDDHDFDPCTPEMRPIARVSIDPDELKKDDFGLSQTGVHGDFTDDSASLASKKGPKQHNDMFGPGKVRKVLNFHEVGRGGAEQNNDKNQAISESERSGKSETDIQALKEALSKLEAEKQAGLLQYQQTLERLSKLESEFSCAQQDSKGLNERASKAEAEVESLRESLAEVEDERKASLLQYQQCLDRISNLESSISRAHEDAGELHDRASKAENKAEFLREEMSRLKAEKESLLAKYMEALEKIANLENKLLLAEDYSSRTSERADIAEKEVESLKQTVSWLTEEKEALALQYQQCLKKIATLEHEIALVQEEAERLKVEVQEEVAKLKGAEEQCVLLDRSNKSLQSELDTLMHKMGLQNQELSEKQQELGRLWTCIQEERMRFMEAEASFQTLQNLHSKTQEELRSAGLELQKRMQILQDMETHNQKLQDEVKMIKDENKNLNDINLSSAVSIERLQTEMSDLKEGKGKLEELVLRLDQTNALQQKIYCLKEEVSDLNKKHRNIVGQVESVGFEPECFSSSVKGLQDENSNLKESCQKIESEKVVLAEKLELMEKLIEKNTLLENSLSDLGAELEGAREKVKALEESYELLTGEKSAVVAEKVTLISQLDITTENLEKLSERNNFLENSLSDATTELEALRMKCKNLEDSCRLLNGENSVLIAEKQTLASQLESIHKSLEELGRRHAELELRYSSVEEERQIKLRQVEELEVCLDVEKKEHANSVQLSQVRMADLENQISVLQEVGDHMREEFEEELDKAVHAQLEIFILQRSVQDLKEENSSLMGSCEKLLEASKLSEKLISELEHENLEKVDEVRMLSDQVKELRMGMFKLLTALKIDTSPANEDYSSEDRSVLLRILSKLDDMENSLQKAWDENQELVIQKSILVAVIRELKHNMSDLNTIMITLSQGLEIRNQQLVMLQKETQKLLQSNEELMLKVRDGNQKEIALATELFELQGAYRDLHRENCKVIKENGFLMNAVTGLQMEKHDLEEKYSHLYGEALTLDNISLLFKNIVSEKSLEVINLTGNLDELCGANDLLEEKIRIMEEKMEEVRMKNMTLELSLKRSDDELKEARIANDELKAEIENRKNILCLKEMECEDLRESFEKFDAQIHKTHNEHAETLLRLEALHSEVENGKEEVKLWETVASTFFTEVQSASVREALLKDKFSELIKLYENLDDESYLKGVEIRELKEKVGILEGENSEVKSQLAPYISAILCIRESVASLEKHTTYRDSAIKEHLESAQKSTEEIATAQSDELLDLQDLQSRIKSIENAFIEAKKQPEHEHSTVQIESLKPRTLSRRGSTKSSRHSTSREDEECNPGIIERDESLPKDIMLDQISEPSSRRKIRREKDHVDDQLLDLWDPTDRAGKPTLDIVRERKSRRSSSESLVEKELGVDEQERPSERIPSLHHEENKRKTLERLASDIQKLTNLQITVQDLKEKLDLTQTNVRKQKSIEYDNMKDQLEETEKTILKLFDYGGKLMKNVEGSMSSSSFDGLFSMELSDGSGSRKRRVSDQARRISEKIGRLQLEVQKVQFFLMKSNNNRPGKTGGRITEPNTRVVLQDYLYGSTAKRSWRRKKARFCGCIQPPTKSD